MPDCITEATNIHVVTNHTESPVHSPVYTNIDTKPVFDLAKIELLKHTMRCLARTHGPNGKLENGPRGVVVMKEKNRSTSRAHQDGVLKAGNVQKYFSGISSASTK